MSTLDATSILRTDGTVIAIADILTAAQGQELLDELDTTICKIEGQLTRFEPTLGHCDAYPEWKRRAELAHKRKRRLRPALQQRIAELRKAERQPATTVVTSHEDARRKAFVKAAKAILPGDTFDAIWSRARQARPELFPEGTQP